jgi:hypothetical protein
MKYRLLSLVLLWGMAALPALAENLPTTPIPDGVSSAVPDDGIRQIDCDIVISYDDGTDDTGSFGWTLGGPSAPYWYLGVRFTPPNDQEYLIQGVTFFSEFWVTAGNVTIRAYELSDPTNETSEVMFINTSGNFELEFTNPICVGAGSDFGIVFCPSPGVWGVLGEDLSAPQDLRSYQNNTDTGGCELITVRTDGDLIVQACVTPCIVTPTEVSTWGLIKSMYR